MSFYSPRGYSTKTRYPCICSPTSISGLVRLSIVVWATFKVFGLTGLMLAFMVGQGFYISRFLKDEEGPNEPPGTLPAGGVGPDSP